MKAAICWVVLAFWLGACQALQGVDVPATLQAQNDAFATEAAGIVRTAGVERTQVLETAFAAETQVARANNVNQQLLATVQMVMPPTPAVVPGIAPDNSTGGEMMMDTADVGFTSALPGIMQFVDTGTTSGIRRSDGCADGYQTEFSRNTPQIYVVSRALTISAGTVMSVDWSYEGQIVLQDTWTVDANAENYCVWYFITPNDVALTPGNWSARLYANGQSIDPIISFRVVE
jgi:hypothetical protein